MKTRLYILSLLPTGAGIILALLAGNQWVSNPVIYLRGNLAVLALFSGVLLSVCTGVGLRYWFHRQEKQQRDLQSVRTSAAEDRRRFLFRLDHELKNPLTAIQAGLSNVSDETLGEYHRGEIEAVKSQVLRISRLVADLRKLAALETAAPECTAVNTADLLTEVVEVFENDPETQDRSLGLILPNAPRPLPEVQADPDLLLLAIHNLVENAVKFTACGDTIEVRASEYGNEIVIEIADTGPGIPEKEIDEVWEELYRGEHSRGIPGSGLGLSLVRTIIEKHGGSVELRSLHGQGTVFSIRLPIRY